MKKIKNDNKKGFTLAEVLVTLTILGVIAAIVVPGLVTKQQERSYVSKLKKNIAIIDNAISMAIVDNGEISQWNANFSTKLAPYLKTISASGNSMTLKDGATLTYAQTVNASSCVTSTANKCGTLTIDINGGAVEAAGLDQFTIDVKLSGLAPSSTAEAQGKAFYTNKLGNLTSN